MFAIRINPETIDKIGQTNLLNSNDYYAVRDLFQSKDYIFITGYVPDRGEMEAWSILPMSVFKYDFDYDPVKIQTDWDIVVKHPK